MADSPDSELTNALRTQVNDLLSQVTQLNAKLVSSYDRISDLEDSLHISSAQLRQSSVKINEMELEREKHRAMIEGGLLVEKAHVTQELTRLMVEASLSKRKGDEDRSQLQRMEKELDELSAGLFEQANNMVREARIERDEQTQKRETAETALVTSEELVRSLQGRLGELSAELELVQSGRHPIRKALDSPQPTRHLLSTSQPYTEFLLFIAHLRTLHPSSQNPPSMSTLLSLPWLSRVGTEDVDPTLRLDLAPALNWLSRRSVLSAIHSGSLLLEPVPPEYFNEFNHTPSCALCGVQVLPGSQSTSVKGLHGGDAPHWSVERFKKSLAAYAGDAKSDQHSVATTASSQYSSPPPTPPRVRTPPPIPNATSTILPFQVYIFRVPSQLPSATAANPGNTVTQTYTLCTSGTCFSRLRTTCSLFTYIRDEVVGGIWKEEIPSLPLPEIPQRNPSRQGSRAGLSAFAPSLSNLSRSHSPSAPPTNGPPPPVPPRKRSLWGTMQNAWSSVSSSSAPSSPTRNNSAANSQPQSQPHVQPHTAEVHRVPPPLPSKSSEEPASSTTGNPVPPPLPQRSSSRRKISPTPTDEDAPPESSEAETPAKEEEILFDHNDHEHEHDEQPKVQAKEEKPTDASDTSDSSPEKSQSDMPAHLAEVNKEEVARVDAKPNNTATTSPTTTTPGTPPPIPRRAATRGTPSRPLSFVKPSSEATPAEVAPSPDVKLGVPEDKDATKDKADEKADSQDQEPKSENEEQIKSDKIDHPSGQNVPHEERPTNEATNLTEAQGTDANRTLTNSPLEDATTLPTPAETPSDVDRAVTPTPATPIHPEAPDNASTDSIISSVDSNRGAQQGGVDPGLYISSRTWEERAWKELNRLREEMFWSRSGGVLV